MFLPGAGEIRRTETLLKERVQDETVDIVALFGALDAREQDRAISPAPAGRRKVVLATSIAETSLTIEGVRVVIDSGLSRVPRYEPDVGLTRLETVRVSRAAADQRRGRAGRTEPGVCYRLWDEPQTGVARALYAAGNPVGRPLLLRARSGAMGRERPRQARISRSAAAGRAQRSEGAARRAWRASTQQGRITDEGRKLRALPLPPRLARMVVDAAAEGAGAQAAAIAAVLTERGLGGDDPDLRHRLDQFRRDRSRRAEDARAMVRRWAEMAGGKGHGDRSPGSLLALAYPDRIAKNRGGGSGGFLLANGRGGNVDAASALAREPFLAVAELTGAAAASRIILAAPITPDEIEARFAGKIEDRETVTFDAASASLRARRSRRLGALVLSEQIKAVEPAPTARGLLAEGIAALGIGKLPWSKAQLQLRDRVQFLRQAEGEEWPDLSDGALARKPPTGWRRSSAARRRCRRSAPTIYRPRWTPCCRGRCASASTPKRRLISPRRPARLCRSIMRPSRDRRSRSACRNCSGLPTIRRSRAGACRW